MKTGLIITIVGIVISFLGVYGYLSSEGFTNGAITLVIGYPLVIIGIVWVIISTIKKRKE